MESLPLLPGYVFAGGDPMCKDYKLKQKLKFLNGFRVIRDNFNTDDFSRDAKFVEYNPEMTYGRPRRPRHEHPRFVPHYVLYEHKTLSFEAYFKVGIFGSPDEHYRVRRVRLLYYLEDDTLAVMEPPRENAGFKQGKLVRRHRVPRPDKPGRFYHWKDLNVGIDFEMYGVTYRIANCDTFTREFLTSQGVDVNEPEEVPEDPYLLNRALAQARDACQPDHRSKLLEDKRYRFLEYDGMVLTFDASWQDEPYKLYYFLADDTIAINAVRQPNDGKDTRGPMLRRTKVPKNWKDMPSTYAPIYMERTDDDVRVYYSPQDLRVGETVFIFGRRFFLHDCDSFTRRYYTGMLGMQQSDRIPMPHESAAEECRAAADGGGSNAAAIRAASRRRERQRDLVRQLYNFPKRLRYSMVMDAVHPEDEGRRFVLEYGLADGCLRIVEVPQRNSGRPDGCFLGWTRVPKPGDHEHCYTPEDFRVGARLNVFGWWFVITGTEPYVYKYMMANKEKFDEGLRENIAAYLRREGLISEEDEECRREEAKQEEPKEDFCAKALAIPTDPKCDC